MKIVLFDARAKEKTLEARNLVLERRDRAIFAGVLELLVIAASFLGYDLRQCAMIPIVSSCLFLLAGIGVYGAMQLDKVKTLIHALLFPAFAAAMCANFVFEICIGVVDESSKHGPPIWALASAILLPYFVAMCLSIAGGLLGIALFEFQEEVDEENECSSESSDNEAAEMRMQAARSQDTCCICFTAGKEAALVPCGHKALCLACAEVIKERGQKCPICRSRVSDFIRVYD